MAGTSKPSHRPDVRRDEYARRTALSMAVDQSSLDALFDGLEEDISEALRPAIQAGAEVIYQAVLKNVDAIGAVSGNLRNAIYQAFAEKDSVATAAGYSRVTYRVSWNARRAPHGHLVEFGHIQRYAAHLGDDGRWHTVVRPDKRGQPRPRRGASQAEKDAYYVLRAGGPQQIAARPFMRPAFYRQGEAIAAVEAKLWDVLGKKR